MYKLPSIILTIFLSLAFVLHSNAQTRDCDPVVVTGTDLACVNGENPQDVVAFKYENGTGWIQIPMQIDERIVLDIVTPYDAVEVANLPMCRRNSTRDIAWNVLFYADAKTHVGADTDASFDNDDELVFMAKDVGDQRVGTVYPTGTVAGSLCELMVEEPLSGNSTLGYIYLFLQNGSLDQAAGADYVTYNFTYANNYLNTYTECPPTPDMNLENSTITSNNYELGFSERWTEEVFKIKVGDEIDILDRHQLFINAGSCNSVEERFSNEQGAHIAAIDGPIRAIRSVMGTSSGPLTQLDLTATECQISYNLAFRLHPANGFNDVYDMSPIVSGDMTYYSEQNPAGVTVDGNNDALTTTDPDEWALYVHQYQDNSMQQVSSSLVISWDYDTDMTIGTAAQYNNGNSTIYDCDLRAYYDDKGNAASHNCTGDNEAYGSSGFTLRTKACTDLKYESTLYPECISSPFYFNIKRVHYALPTAVTTAEAMQYDQFVKNPLGVTAISDPLPVELQSFKTEARKEHIALTWTTASEVDNSHFEVERSEDGKVFKKIGRVEGNGTTLEEKSYAYDDRQVLAGQIYYYRLKQVDFNGDFEYSAIQSAKLEEQDSDFKIYPNPASGSERLRLVLETANGKLRFQVLDVYGKVVKEVERDFLSKEKAVLTLDTSDIPAGIYFIKTSTGQVGQFLKQ
ncbi:MAG: T9SS type A sorting domain-containing protein [Bacteroidota bacterium]